MVSSTNLAQVAVTFAVERVLRPVAQQDRQMLQLHNNLWLNAAMQKMQASVSAPTKALKALWK
jgi:hypothetical protein